MTDDTQPLGKCEHRDLDSGKHIHRGDANNTDLFRVREGDHGHSMVFYREEIRELAELAGFDVRGGA